MKKFDPIAFASTILIILALIGFSFLSILAEEHFDILQVKLIVIVSLLFLGHKLYDYFKTF